MITHMRTAAAIVAGVLVTLVLLYGGLVVFVLVTIGIPLGAQPRPLSTAEYGLQLALAGVAAAVGGRVAARLARERHQMSVLGVAVILALVVLWGFSGRNSWPEWWGPAMAAVSIAGTVLGGLGVGRRPLA